MQATKRIMELLLTVFTYKTGISIHKFPHKIVLPDHDSLYRYSNCVVGREMAGSLDYNASIKIFHF